MKKRMKAILAGAVIVAASGFGYTRLAPIHQEALDDIRRYEHAEQAIQEEEQRLEELRNLRFTTISSLHNVEGPWSEYDPEKGEYTIWNNPINVEGNPIIDSLVHEFSGTLRDVIDQSGTIIAIQENIAEKTRQNYAGKIALLEEARDSMHSATFGIAGSGMAAALGAALMAAGLAYRRREE